MGRRKFKIGWKAEKLRGADCGRRQVASFRLQGGFLWVAESISRADVAGYRGIVGRQNYTPEQTLLVVGCWFVLLVA